MRELKFRAWDKRNKVMCVVESYRQYSRWVECVGNSILMLEGNSGNEPATGILMQYTGLKDKNGKEIYEGDIVKGRFMSYLDDDLRTGQIIFAEGGFQFTDKHQQDFYFPVSQLKDHQVIGNIYENPELLEASHEE